MYNISGDNNNSPTTLTTRLVTADSLGRPESIALTLRLKTSRCSLSSSELSRTIPVLESMVKWSLSDERRE